MALRRSYDQAVGGAGAITKHMQKEGEDDKSDRYIYVKNFPLTWTETDFVKIFARFGSAEEYRVIMDNSGHSRGFGYVIYDESDSAVIAENYMNGEEVDGKVIQVHRITKYQHGNQSDTDAAKVKVGAVKHEAVKEHHYSSSGSSSINPNSASEYLSKVNYNKVPPPPSGYESIDKKDLYLLRQKQFSGRNLYINNLDKCIDDGKLHNLFKRFGSVKSVRVITAESGQSRGYGFVCFNTMKAAIAAVNFMNGEVIESNIIQVSFAEDRSDKEEGDTTTTDDGEKENEKAGKDNPFRTMPRSIIPDFDRYHKINNTKTTGQYSTRGGVFAATSSSSVTDSPKLVSVTTKNDGPKLTPIEKLVTRMDSLSFGRKSATNTMNTSV